MPVFLFDENIYMSQDLTYNKIKRKIKKCIRFPYIFKLYCITFASNEKDQLDIIRTDMFFQKYYKDKEIRVYGFTNDEASAFELVRTIVDDCLKETGNVNVKEYLKCREH